ncbi:hypothetical protein A3E66_00060 [Candidatus Daviesbacteria bacterium RIFCSPHIGHO2_12_FULL_37_16]|uniref:Uncharacterized protein n=3 Tax=Candidatus Daviesiibacteriota TaxID=1752718 RepID=A0A0G0I1S0_9BACT|nr:MAG: hypothetical protein US19_C0009G0063 [Candidatus Daviesbacteria bacterium GW2011_GWB1_36_5]KKQ15948.1 MAG: hypothetical protein US28_C0007G0039 [Candidatus Daviesbacteria bacterium GW2011_GWA1_36_8]OGE32853.1 MAG: hypothetical protein A3C99_02385 [Candidatus Daviesbacteria bacterium RIFCSPHIGHO2_02_FULL_37_9]OGE34952.1 MAG: hypothetical protein A3E66_00060 [Candidatus Daviesbacteria bacterium RIFCSPHIGHO2_12_FULL_37_16]
MIERNLEINIKQVPSFESVGDLRRGLERKRLNLGGDLYPRDGSSTVSSVEERIGGLIGVPAERIVSYNSGMGAIVDLISQIKPSRAVFAEGLYSQSGWLFKNELPDSGVRTTPAASGEVSRITEAVVRSGADTIFLETVANEADMEMVDIEELLKDPVLEELKPNVILDNTLPTSLRYRVYDLLQRYQGKGIVVESLTKNYGLNEVLGGFLYSPNDEVIGQLRDRRKRRGSGLSEYSAQVLEADLDDGQNYLKRAELTARNTFKIAQAWENAKNPLVRVHYPNLDSHPQSKLANRLFPDGVAPVFFADLSIDQWSLTQALWENPNIREFGRLGQSFGFDSMRILPEESAPIIRISGGMEDEMVIFKLREEFFKIITGVTKSSIPTGQRVSGMDVRIQAGDNCCGQAVLEMLGYDISKIDPWRGLTNFDIAEVIGSRKFLFDLPENEGAYIVNGTKIETGNPHWFLVAEGNVFDPEVGVRDRNGFIEDKFSEINGVIPVSYCAVPTR